MEMGNGTYLWVRVVTVAFQPRFVPSIQARRNVFTASCKRIIPEFSFIYFCQVFSVITTTTTVVVICFGLVEFLLECFKIESRFLLGRFLLLLDV
jgi:hypothetical protein